MSLQSFIFAYVDTVQSSLLPDQMHRPTMATPTPTTPPPPTIDALPVEILAHVFSFLDSAAPSDLRLHDQPHAHMLKNPHLESQHLKNVSLVSAKWRATVLPLLFRHVVWYLDRFDLMQAEQLKTSPSALPFLPFLRDNSLSSYVRTLAFVVVKSERCGAAGDVGLYRRGDGSGHYGYSPDPMGPSSRRVGGERDMVFNEDSNWLWKLVFDVVSPLRFTLIASPRMLASLLARMLFLGDAWSFNQSHHVLSLSRDPQKDVRTTPPDVQTEGVSDNDDDDNDALDAAIPPASPMASAPATSRPSSSSSVSLARPLKRVPCQLFTLRPWTRLLLNEGSSTRVYKTYEYFHKRPPSMLGALLGAEEFPNDEPLVPATIRDLSYVSIFPLSSHFNTLVQHLPRLERLFVQLVPRNDILKDRREMEHLDMDDLWAERNVAYGKIMPKLFDSSNSAANWRHLRVFESGDAADRESWNMAVEYVKRFGAEWRVEREGVFVKRRPQDDDDDAQQQHHHHHHHHSTSAPHAAALHEEDSDADNSELGFSSSDDDDDDDDDELENGLPQPGSMFFFHY